MRKKILVIDDDDDILFLIKNIIQNENYIIETSNNSTDALKKVQFNQYDLIIIDMHMPKLSGVKLCHILSNQFAILAMSSDQSVETRSKILGTYDGFLEKKDLKEKIESSISMAINRRKLKDEVAV